MIDTEAVLASGPGRVTVAEWIARSAEVKAAKRKAQPEEKRRRTIYINDKVAAELAAGKNETEAHAQWSRAVERQELGPDFLITMRDGVTVTVKDILAAPEQYDGERCCDPLDPGYRDDPRVAYINLSPKTGSPYIHSHAHGGGCYQLKEQREPELQQDKADKEDKDKEEKLSQAQRILELAHDIEFFHTPGDDPYAHVIEANRQRTLKVKGRPFAALHRLGCYRFAGNNGQAKRAGRAFLSP